MASIAINGLGQIGRAALKVLEQAGGVEVAAVNDLVPADNLAYLLRYDTVCGRWHTTVTADSGALVVGGRKIPVLAERDPASLPWKTLGVTWCWTGSWSRSWPGTTTSGGHLPDDPGGVRSPLPPGPRSQPGRAVKVREIMTARVATVAPDTPVPVSAGLLRARLKNLILVPLGIVL